ncbi:MAG: hypothetical protein BWX48_02651 [Verrucomicrobia bacterium ADurb.Bin006]|nr:MAG: hypothetical protein BWX48_02651 [Verrucomicrobia bacterium ADurb.Bin006]
MDGLPSLMNFAPVRSVVPQLPYIPTATPLVSSSVALVRFNPLQQ